jgi:transcription elongation factor Elf1
MNLSLTIHYIKCPICQHQQDHSCRRVVDYLAPDAESQLIPTGYTCQHCDIDFEVTATVKVELNTVVRKKNVFTANTTYECVTCGHLQLQCANSCDKCGGRVVPGNL